MSDYAQQLAAELNLSAKNVQGAIDLIDQGNTIPFIARYRKEVTGSMDDQVLRDLGDRLEYLRGLDKRKEEVTSSITEQGAMTPELTAALSKAKTLAEVEDLYRPYKPKRRTRATVAKEKGLEPLAALLFAQERDCPRPEEAAADYLSAEKGVETVADALQGANDIVAEWISDDAAIRRSLRELLEKRGCPFFKRRSLFTPYGDELRRTDGMAARELCAYLHEKTSFPLDLLLVSLLKTQPLAALSKNLHWRYVVGMPTQTQADPAVLGLRLIRYALPKTDPVTDWYTRQAAAQADALMEQAAIWFEKQPLLGILSPSVPLYAGCAAAQRRQWLAEKESLQSQAKVPVGEEPLPAPNCGWMLVRESAFPQGIPDCKNQHDAWRLALIAQANGAYAASFETAAQAVARADILNAYETAAAQPAAVAKQLGRLIKHRLQTK